MWMRSKGGIKGMGGNGGDKGLFAQRRSEPSVTPRMRSRERRGESALCAALPV